MSTANILTTSKFIYSNKLQNLYFIFLQYSVKHLKSTYFKVYDYVFLFVLGKDVIYHELGMELPRLKIVFNLPWTYKKLHCTGEPYRFSGYRNPSQHRDR